MKQVVFVSGKGGTGKSTVTAVLSRLLRDKRMADCDVDAPNLHLLLPGETRCREGFSGAETARVDPQRCVRCGRCRQVCRFDAVGEDFTIDPIKCEGCGACALACPRGAVALSPVQTGETFVEDTPWGVFSRARLFPGAEGSGKLVTRVRRNLEGQTGGEEWALIDGSPGIGCAVIASITGTDALVAVCEPTLSGQSDLIRVLAVARHFGVPAFVCINKHDLNPGVTGDIEDYCRENGFPIIGRLPFDPAVVTALQRLQTPVEAGLTAMTGEIAAMWDRLTAALSGGEPGE